MIETLRDKNPQMLKQIDEKSTPSPKYEAVKALDEDSDEASMGPEEAESNKQFMVLSQV